MPYTYEEFAKLIRNKYPQYAGTNDTLLVNKLIEKYPGYKEYLQEEAPKKEKWYPRVQPSLEELIPREVAESVSTRTTAEEPRMVGQKTYPISKYKIPKLGEGKISQATKRELTKEEKQINQQMRIEEAVKKRKQAEEMGIPTNSGADALIQGMYDSTIGMVIEPSLFLAHKVGAFKDYPEYIEKKKITTATEPLIETVGYLAGVVATMPALVKVATSITKINPANIQRTIRLEKLKGLSKFKKTVKLGIHRSTVGALRTAMSQSDELMRGEINVGLYATNIAQSMIQHFSSVLPEEFLPMENIPQYFGQIGEGAITQYLTDVALQKEITMEEYLTGAIMDAYFARMDLKHFKDPNMKRRYDVLKKEYDNSLKDYKKLAGLNNTTPERLVEMAKKTQDMYQGLEVLKEVTSAKETTPEIRETGEEKRIEGKEEEGIRVRDIKEGEEPKEVERHFPAEKQAWEMTRKEWEYEKEKGRPETFGSATKLDMLGAELRLKESTKLDYGVIDEARQKLKKAKNGEITLTKEQIEEYQDRLDTPVFHKDVIKKALSEGKPVPEAVLKDYPELVKEKPANKFIHDFNSKHDVDIVVDVFKETAKKFDNAKDYQDYIQKAGGIWSDIEARYKEDIGKDLPDNYMNYLAEQSQIEINKDIGSKKRGGSFDFEKVIDKYGKAETKEVKKPETLIEEAKKYDSANEFITTSGEPVYHGTTKPNAKAIEKEGFVAGKGKGMAGGSRKHTIYVSPIKRSAKWYGKDRLNIEKYGGATVVEGKLFGKLLEIKGFNDDYKALGKAMELLDVPYIKEGKATHIINFEGLKKALAKQDFVGVKFKDRDAGGRLSYAILDYNAIKTKSQLTDIWNKAHPKITEVETEVGKQRTFETMDKLKIPEQKIKIKDTGEEGELFEKKSTEKEQMQLKPKEKAETTERKVNTVYRIQDPDNPDKYYVTTKGSLGGWKKYLGAEDKDITEIKVKQLYLPNTDISIKNVDDLQKRYDSGEISDKDIRNVYPEESGIQNLEQYEIRKEDIISTRKVGKPQEKAEKPAEIKPKELPKEVKELPIKSLQKIAKEFDNFEEFSENYSRH
nr:hypothetical protein [Bacteroidota bacterium]